MASLYALLATVLSVQLQLSSAQISPEGLDVTRFFSFEASSTCGETPPSGSASGVGLPDCLSGERIASFALDDDVETWWQSEAGESLVELTFSLQNVSSNSACMHA